LDILLIDASRPIQYERLLPAGRLREPLSAMGRASLVVFTRTETEPGTSEAIGKLSQFPVFSAATRLLGFRRYGSGIRLQSIEEIGAGPFLGFCGIGNPEAFFRDLQQWGLAICGRAILSDHHVYSQQDILSIQEAGKKAGAKAFVTTEKDMQNLNGSEFSAPLYVSVIDLQVSPEADFRDVLDRLLAAKLGAAA
jgi:tetraacyldisaccharide 4'-kinase